MSKKAVAFMLVMVMILSMPVLAACSGGTEKENSANEEDAYSYGGSIVVGITQDLDSLDPHKAVAAGTKEVLYNIFDGLVKSDEEGNFYGALASDYSLSEDGMRYSFTLRKGVKFHNGKEVAKADVVYSIKRLAGLLEPVDPEVVKVSAFSVIEDVVETENGVDVVLNAPNTELISFFTCAIIPADYENQASAPVGAGPFRFVSYSPLTSIVLAKNEDYYVAGVPYLDQVTFKISADTNAAFVDLLGGTIDIFPHLTDEQSAKCPATHRVEYGDMNLVQALFLNNEFEPFSDIRVRQAICHAVDRQLIIDLVGGGRGTAVGSTVFSSFGKLFDASLAEKYPHDVEKAKALLAEAGYADGLEFTIKVPSNYDFHVQTTQVIVESLKEAGINAKISQIEWASWISDVYVGRDYEATVVGLDSQLAPSDIFRFYPSSSSKNFVNYFNDKFDEVFEKAKTETDDAKKMTYYNELQKMLSDDAVSAFIQSPVEQVAINAKLAGYRFMPIFVLDMSNVHYVNAADIK